MALQASHYDGWVAEWSSSDQAKAAGLGGQLSLRSRHYRCAPREKALWLDGVVWDLGHHNEREATTVAPDDVPRLLTSNPRERWRGVQRGASDYIAAYQIQVDDALPQTLDAIRSHPARETCTVLEIAGDGTHTTIAAACAFQTDTPPDKTAPVAGLTPQRGNHLPALTALDLLSTQRLDGHTDAPADLLTRLHWPTVVGGAHRAPLTETART